MIHAQHKRLRLEIVQDNPGVGFYLYVYNGDQCIADHLQDSEDVCKECALEEYGVPVDSWVETFGEARNRGV